MSDSKALVCVAVSGLVTALPVHAQDAPDADEVEEGHRNLLQVKGLFTVAGVKVEAAEGGGRETALLGGFAFVYTRIISERWLEIEVAAPFISGEESIEAPIDVHLLKPWSLGSVELFTGAGVSLSMRYLRNGADGDDFDFVPGLSSVSGFIWYFAPATGLTMSVDFNVYPGEGRELECSPGLGFVTAF